MHPIRHQTGATHFPMCRAYRVATLIDDSGLCPEKRCALQVPRGAATVTIPPPSYTCSSGDRQRRWFMVTVNHCAACDDENEKNCVRYPRFHRIFVGGSLSFVFHWRLFSKYAPFCVHKFDELDYAGWCFYSWLFYLPIWNFSKYLFSYVTGKMHLIQIQKKI